MFLFLTPKHCDVRSRYNLNEIVQSWCYAQELETIEHAFMNLVATLCGQVRPTPQLPLMCLLIE
jgi:hypothetical protein